MRKVISVGLSVVLASLVLGCSKDDDKSSSSTNYLFGESVIIQTTTDAIRALHVISAARDEGVSHRSATIDSTVKCASGSYLVEGETPDSDSVYEELTYTYENCLIGSGFGATTTNGVVTISSGDYERIIETNDYKVDTANKGTITYNMTRESYKSKNDGTFRKSVRNGTSEFDYTSPSNRGQEAYQDFTEIIEVDGGERIDGGYSFESSKFSCAEGTYEITTNEVIHNTGILTDGEIEINGVKYVFNTGGKATVTFEDGRREVITISGTLNCN